jgi:hypothetical protein
MVKQRGKQVKQRGKSSKKPLVKGKGSAKKRVSKRISSKRKRTPMAHGRSDMEELVDTYISSLPSDLKPEYNKLDTTAKDSIKLELQKKAETLKEMNYTKSEIKRALDDELANELDM